jgi:hypothetical protein
MADKDKLAKYRTEIQQVSAFRNSVASSSQFSMSSFIQLSRKGQERIGFPKSCAWCGPILESTSPSGHDLHKHILRMRAVTFYVEDVFHFRTVITPCLHSGTRCGALHVLISPLVFPIYMFHITMVRALPHLSFYLSITQNLAALSFLFKASPTPVHAPVSRSYS